MAALIIEVVEGVYESPDFIHYRFLRQSDYIDLNKVVDDFPYLGFVLGEEDHLEEICFQHDCQLVGNILGAALFHSVFFDSLTDESCKVKIQLGCSAGYRILEVFEFVDHFQEVVHLLLVGIGLVEDVIGDACYFLYRVGDLSPFLGGVLGEGQIGGVLDCILVELGLVLEVLIDRCAGKPALCRYETEVGVLAFLCVYLKGC